MDIYLVTPDSARAPAARVAAADLIDLGNQVASHLARHRLIRRGMSFQAQIGDGHGAINQSGLLRPVTFTIHKES